MYKRNVKNLNSLFLRRILNRRKSLAEFIFIKTGMPVGSEEFHNMRVKDVKKKRKMKHEEFHKLLIDLRKKVDVLESIYTNDVNVTNAYDLATPYYYIPIENLF